MITKLEEATKAESTTELVIYPLGKPLNPTPLTTLTTLVPGAQMSLSTDGKQLVAVARPQDQAVIKKTLDQISVSVDAAKKFKLEFYQVDGVSAAQLQAFLQHVAVESTITVDATQDRLIVWGPEAEHTAFAEVVTKLKEDPLAGTKPVLEFYPLADETMSTNLTSVLRKHGPSGEGHLGSRKTPADGRRHTEGPTACAADHRASDPGRAADRDARTPASIRWMPPNTRVPGRAGRSACSGFPGMRVVG